MDSRPDGWSDGSAANSERTKEVPMNALTPRDHPPADNDYRRLGEQSAPPIVAAVDGSAASRVAVGEAVRLAGELEAPIVFVYVRRGPAGFFGAPVYERRLTAEMASARRVLHDALAVADTAGVPAASEVLEGSPRRRISEFARDRGARLIVVGSRRHKLGQSVSSGVIRSAGRPVIVTHSLPRLSAVA
jgi:nucleotide-binding universal stress UspA family protein